MAFLSGAHLFLPVGTVNCVQTQQATNQESQKILYKNGASLVGALNFFTENLGTFVYTTIEDTLQSYRDFQLVRLEYVGCHSFRSIAWQAG
jgi:hypothetical protein